MPTQNHNHNHNPNFPTTLESVYDELQRLHPLAQDPVFNSRDDCQFLAVRQSQRDEIDTAHLRNCVTSLLGLNDQISVVQIVGDSGSGFSAAGIERVIDVIRDAIVGAGSKAREEVVLEYGYTANSNDVNCIVNELIASDLDLARRTVANVVYESAKAVEEWGCEATGYVRSYVLAYDEAGHTRFGDDVFLSDGVMRGDMGDRMICVEGGVQAFEQVVGVMERGVGVVAVTGNLRVEGQEKKFSAARMFEDCVDVDWRQRSDEMAKEEWVARVRDSGVPMEKPESSVKVEKALERLSKMRGRLLDVDFVLVD